jgi:hypothetical protein
MLKTVSTPVRAATFVCSHGSNLIAAASEKFAPDNFRKLSAQDKMTQERGILNTNLFPDSQFTETEIRQGILSPRSKCFLDSERSHFVDLEKRV